MASQTNFEEYYKTISNSELLHILEYPDEYQPAAVEAAGEEFKARQLSDTEIKEAKEFLLALQIKRVKQNEKVKVFENRVKATGYSMLETLNPIQTGVPPIEKTIRLIAIVFSGYFIFQVISDYQLIKAYTQDFTHYPIISFLILLPILILPIAVFTFWKRWKIGWTLLVIFLNFVIISVLVAFYQTFFWKPSGFAVLDDLISRPSPLMFISQLLFFAGTLYVLCKKNLRDAFFINNNEMRMTIAITAVISFFLILAIP